MDEARYLLTVGEMTLKGKNIGQFENRLKESIRNRLMGKKVRVQGSRGRFFLRCGTASVEEAESVLSRTFGLMGYARVHTTGKSMEAVEAKTLEVAALFAGENAGRRFKVQARRTDKSFPVSSYEICCRLGEIILDAFPGLVVDIHKPDWILHVEIREQAYVYGPLAKATGGMPAGSAGRGLLLISGGIDSPVAGWLMGRRGLFLEAVHFHTRPYTPEQSRQKVEALVQVLAGWQGTMRLYVVPFTEVQIAIRDKARPDAVTLLSRACMMRIARRIAARRRLRCLVTGESLGQVASQTVESLGFTDSAQDLVVFRPCIGMDKNEIIRVARKLGTFDTSILPYDDCCTFFAPKHPLIRPNRKELAEMLEAMNLDEMMDKAADESEVIVVKAD